MVACGSQQCGSDSSRRNGDLYTELRDYRTASEVLKESSVVFKVGDWQLAIGRVGRVVIPERARGTLSQRIVPTH